MNSIANNFVLLTFILFGSNIFAQTETLKISTDTNISSKLIDSVHTNIQKDEIP